MNSALISTPGAPKECLISVRPPPEVMVTEENNGVADEDIPIKISRFFLALKQHCFQCGLVKWFWYKMSNINYFTGLIGLGKVDTHFCDTDLS